ncbi:hypothetical protein Tco_1313468 [Tanacetum coccineum]
MISNEFAVKLLINYEEKNGEKIAKNDFLVALNGELYFTYKRNSRFWKRGYNDLPDLEFFGDDSDNSNDSGYDWDAILSHPQMGPGRNTCPRA